LATVEVDPDRSRPLPETRDRGRQVVLRLLSPGLFVDAAGRPVADPDPDELHAVLGVAEVQVERHWVRWVQVGGWHVASGLPKPVEHAVSAGSVYLIRCTPAPAEAGLRRLADQGVGLRRAEGFGVLGGTPPVAYTRQQVLDRTAALRGVQDTPLMTAGLLPALRQHIQAVRAGQPPGDRLAALGQALPEDRHRRAAAFLTALDDADLLIAAADDLDRYYP
jgi:CRISPR-associated protein Csx10